MRIAPTRSTGPASKAEPAKLFAGEPVHIKHAWDGQPFATPSGKLEFHSEQLARQGIPAMPDWQPDPVEGAEAARWPCPHRSSGRCAGAPESLATYVLGQ